MHAMKIQYMHCIILAIRKRNFLWIRVDLHEIEKPSKNRILVNEKLLSSISIKMDQNFIQISSLNVKIC